MSLDLGTLTGYLEMEDVSFDSTLNGALSNLKDFATKGKSGAKVAGLAIGAVITGSVAKAISAELARDKLAAQLDLTTDESARIGKVAGELYADAYGDSMTDVNNAVGAVISTIDGMGKASADTLEDLSSKALDYAKTFDVDVTRAVSTAGVVLKSGLADDATEAFDLIFKASSQVPAALREDVLDAADEYSQFFAALGYDGPQAFALLVDGADQGMYGIDKAGDAIKEFTIRSTDMSTASKDAYEAIGLNAQDMADKILAGGDDAQDATQKIIDGLLDIEDPSKRANAAIALFGTPLEDLNTTKIPAFLKSLRGTSDAMDDTEGSAKRMGDTLNDNAANSLTSLKRQGERAFLWLGNQLLPELEDLADELGPTVKQLLPSLADSLEVVGDALENITPLVEGVVDAFTSLPDSAQKALILAGGAYMLKRRMRGIGGSGGVAEKAAGGMVLFGRKADDAAGKTDKAAKSTRGLNKGLGLLAVAEVIDWDAVLNGKEGGASKATDKALVALADRQAALDNLGKSVGVTDTDKFFGMFKDFDQLDDAMSTMLKNDPDKGLQKIADAANQFQVPVKGLMNELPETAAAFDAFGKRGKAALAALMSGSTKDELKDHFDTDAPKRFVNMTERALDGVDSFDRRILALPKRALTKIETPGAVQSKHDVIALAKRLDLTPREVSTIMKALDFASKDIRTVVERVKHIPDGHTKVTADTSPARRAIDKLYGRGLGVLRVPVQASIIAGGIPKMADGGIVDEPTLAVVGEAGPEVVRPLSEDQARNGASIDYDRLAAAVTAAMGGRHAPVIGHATIEAHNYSDFTRQMDEKQRLASVGGADFG